MQDENEQVMSEPGRPRPLIQREIDSLWDFADPIASEQRFRDATADSERPAYERAIMSTQVARALGLQGNLDEALAVLDALQSGADSLVEAPSVESSGAPNTGAEAREHAEIRARVVLENGRALLAASRIEDALPVLTRAVREAAAAASAFLVLDALHMLALHDTEHEAEWAAEGFEVLGGTSDPRTLRWSVALHHNLAWTFHDRGDAEAALSEFERGLAAAVAYGTTEQRYVSRWSIARCLRTLERVDEARAIQLELASENPDDPYVHEELTILGVQSNKSDESAARDAARAETAKPDTP